MRRSLSASVPLLLSVKIVAAKPRVKREKGPIASRRIGSSDDSFTCRSGAVSQDAPWLGPSAHQVAELGGGLEALVLVGVVACGVEPRAGGLD